MVTGSSSQKVQSLSVNPSAVITLYSIKLFVTELTSINPWHLRGQVKALYLDACAFTKPVLVGSFCQIEHN